MNKVAVVTGGNKGIGLAIVEKLASHFNAESDDWKVYLTARNEQLGQDSAKLLNDKGVKVHFHQLDIVDESSVGKLAAYMKEKYGGIDILVNNAGIAFKQASTASVAEQAEVTMKTNYFGTLNVCKQVFPLLKPNARVVNVSSMSGWFALNKMSAELRARFVNPTTIDDLTNSMNQFVSDAKEDTLLEKGWSQSCYGTSKAGVTVLTMLQQRDFDKDSRPDIVVNACCPGYVDTDMTSHKGPLTTEQGADTPVYLALLPANTAIKGKYVKEQQVQPWQ